MQNSTQLPYKAWVYLFWSKYNKLSEPLKEGFINLVHSIAEETVNRNTGAAAADTVLIKQQENVKC
jgi:hypothetical protein